MQSSSQLRYVAFPERVILDLREPIEAFHAKTADMDEYEFYIDEVLDQILDYVDEKSSLQAGLNAMREFIEEHYDKDVPTLSQATLELAKALTQCFENFSMYAIDGRLPYRFSRDWQDNFTPIMERVSLTDE